ncbi:MAG TPA: succinylglutamate desuccinylase/aspartoacylase family protein, partial [Thermomicrobiales bacterium]|nr:succinylglutamate desuccinylase/aspartoacylase family protein [Thermomicrobiales bacterium]
MGQPAWWGERRAGEVASVRLGAGDVAVTGYVAAGRRDGPLLVALAGIHGDEYEGPVALAELLAGLREDGLADLAGTLLVVPVANSPAFAAGTRTSPRDGANLARCFPGRQDGAPSERLAHLLTTEAIAPADALFDLHSGGVAYEMALLAGYCAVGGAAGDRSRALAEAFGAPVLWEHPEIAPGRTLSAALDRGIPCLYTEAGGGGGAPEATVRCYVEGVRRVMAALGLLPGGAPAPRHRQRWLGAG